MSLIVSDDTLYIKEVLYQAEFGGTKPVFIRATDEKEYLLKFRDSDQDKDVSIFNEYLGYGLIQHLNYTISPQRYGVLEIDEMGLNVLELAYKEGLLCNESIGYARNSLGPNFIVEKIENIVKPIKIENTTFCSHVKRIDNLIMNRDRYKENPNILKSLTSTQYYAIDFGLAMLESRVHEVLIANTYSTYAMSLGQCDAAKDERYLFKDITQRPKKVDPNEIHDIISNVIDNMPQVWAPVKYKKEIVDLITTRAGSDLHNNGQCPFELF